VLVVARDHRRYALYVLALYLGLRRGELLGLRWTDVDPAAGVLEVRQSLQRIGGELRAVTPKTRSSRRTVPLIGVCVDVLREHRQRQTAERQAAGLAWQDTGSRPGLAGHRIRVHHDDRDADRARQPAPELVLVPDPGGGRARRRGVPRAAAHLRDAAV
jgi:integrase